MFLFSGIWVLCLGGLADLGGLVLRYLVAVRMRRCVIFLHCAYVGLGFIRGVIFRLGGFWVAGFA